MRKYFALGILTLSVFIQPQKTEATVCSVYPLVAIATDNRCANIILDTCASVRAEPKNGWSVYWPDEEGVYPASPYDQWDYSHKIQTPKGSCIVDSIGTMENDNLNTNFNDSCCGQLGLAMVNDDDAVTYIEDKPLALSTQQLLALIGGIIGLSALFVVVLRRHRAQPPK